MENINKDILPLLAFELNYIEILRFCRVSKRINKHVCKNRDFWRNKFFLDFPTLKDYVSSDFEESYKNFEMLKLNLLNTIEYVKHSSYDRVGFINEYFVNFLMKYDFGLLHDTNLPINVLISSYARYGILTRAISLKLLLLYLKQNNLSYIINGVEYYKTNSKLNDYLDFLDIHNLDRNKLSKNDIKFISEKSFIPKIYVSVDNYQLSKTKYVIKQLYKIGKIL